MSPEQTLPSPCLMGGMAFLGLKGSPFLHQIYIAGHCSQRAQFSFHLTTKLSSTWFYLCPYDQKWTSVKPEGAASGPRASFSHRNLSVQCPCLPADTWVLAVSGSLQRCFWVFLFDAWPSWPNVSQQHCVFFLIVANCPMHFMLTNTCLRSCSWDLCCIEMVPNDFPDLFRSTILFVRSVQRSSELPIGAFVARSHSWNKWARRSEQL